MIFFTSDTHFGDANIIRYCNRPFANVTQMNETLIRNWNAVVRAGDTVYHLGDFAYGMNDLTALKVIRARLNGSIVLIEGNHEKLARDLDRSAPGSFDDVCSYKETEVSGQRIVLFHYGLRTWHHDLRGTWHLYGHSHGELPPLGKSFDIGVDCWNFRPLSFDEVKAEMDKREIASDTPAFKCDKCQNFPCSCDNTALYA